MMSSMTARNASRLDPGLIARKGEAAPAPSASSAMAPARAQVEAEAEAATVSVPLTGGEQGSRADPLPIEEKRASPRGLQGTIAVTVRLDPARYERLKVYGARRRRTNQEILVEALDRYLKALAE
jgi:hypothetical protein